MSVSPTNHDQANDLQTSDLQTSDLAAARQLLGPHARFLARGATCVVYTNGPPVTRLALCAEAQLTVQAALQQALANAGLPVAHSLKSGVLPGGRAYSLETTVRGDDSLPSQQGWQDVGAVLQVLHTLPHSGFGLLQDQADRFAGQATTPSAGILTRLPQVWPFARVTLPNQALVQAAPHLLGPLQSLQAELHAVTSGPTAICHTDLHSNQLVWQGGRLSGLLDFGDCTIAPAAWDTASIAYFHGWAVAGQTGLAVNKEAALFGLLLAQHRATRALAQQNTQRLTQAVAFAESCLQRLDP